MKLRRGIVDTHSEEWCREDVAKIELERQKKIEQVKEWEEKKGNDNCPTTMRGLRAAKGDLLILDRRLAEAKERLDKKVEKKRARDEEGKESERRRIADVEAQNKMKDGDGEGVAVEGEDSDYERRRRRRKPRWKCPVYGAGLGQQDKVITHRSTSVIAAPSFCNTGSAFSLQE